MRLAAQAQGRERDECGAESKIEQDTADRRGRCRRRWCLYLDRSEHAAAR